LQFFEQIPDRRFERWVFTARKRFGPVHHFYVRINARAFNRPLSRQIVETKGRRA
jgi:hypothetical protein